MLRLIVRRLLLLPVVMFGTSVVIFALVLTLSPYYRIGLFIRDVQELKRFSAQQLIEKYQLNAPPHVQYINWLKEIASGHMGWSEVAKQPLADVLRARFPATLELTLWAIVPMALGGIWLGTLAAVHHNRLLDHLSRVFAIVGWSLPVFIFGLFFLMVFYAALGWFPPGRLSVWATQVVISPQFRNYTGMVTVDALLNGRLDVFWDAVRHLMGPVVTLSYLYWAQLQRITRSSMLETLRQDYVRTARAKGLDERVVINKHARRNALIPVVTVVGLTALGLLGGVVITETIFAYPGLGSLMAQAALNIDHTTVIGVSVVYAALTVVIITLVDIAYAAVDPRVRVG